MNVLHKAAPYVIGLALGCAIVLVCIYNKFYGVIFAWSVFSFAIGFASGAVWFAKKHIKDDDLY